MTTPSQPYSPSLPRVTVVEHDDLCGLAVTDEYGGEIWVEYDQAEFLADRLRHLSSFNLSLKGV